VGKLIQIFSLLSKTVIFFGFILSSFSQAHACKLSPPSQIQPYHSFENWKHKESGFIALVQAQAIPKKNKKKEPTGFQRSHFSSNNKNWSETHNIKLNVIENLNHHNYDPLERILSHRKLPTKFTYNFLKTEDSYIEQPKNFDFWDRFDVTNSYQEGYRIEFGCRLPYPIIQPNHYYVAFGRIYGSVAQGGYVATPHFLEPVTDPSDPFVQQIRDAISGNEMSPLKISPKSYFQRMTAYADIEIKDCRSDWQEYRYTQLDGGYKRPAVTFANILENYQIEPNKLFLNKLLSTTPSSKLVSDPPNYKCNIGDKFLVVYRPVPLNPRHQFGVLKTRNYPLEYRYLPVTEDKVDRSQILTNYVIQGEDSISVKDIKNWIKSGKNSVR